MFDKDGKNVCALAEMSPQMQQQVPHPFWQCYVTVADVDAAAAKAAELGGTIAVPPMDVFDAGRMASVIDPTGAAINLWQKGTHGGADIIGEPCALAWAELYTPDREKAGRFYTQLLGWTIEGVAARLGRCLSRVSQQRCQRGGHAAGTAGRGRYPAQLVALLRRRRL